MPQPYTLVLIRKYSAVLRMWISYIFAYRVRVLIYFIEDGFYLLAFPFIWLAVYGARQSIAGFERADIVTYFIALGIINTLATAHGGPRLTKEILQGDINQNLVRPLHQLWIRFFHDASYHLISVFITFSFIAVLKLTAPQYIRLPTMPITYFLFALALIGSYIISTCTELTVGCLSFWFGETSGFKQALQMTETVLSGQIAPLIFFPLMVQTVAGVLPFKFQAFIPAQIILEKLSRKDLLVAFSELTVWCVVLICILLFTWKRGLKAYEGVGI